MTVGKRMTEEALNILYEHDPGCRCNRAIYLEARRARAEETELRDDNAYLGDRCKKLEARADRAEAALKRAKEALDRIAGYINDDWDTEQHWEFCDGEYADEDENGFRAPTTEGCGCHIMILDQILKARAALEGMEAGK